MDQPPLFRGPVDAHHVSVTRQDDGCWRLVIATHREGDRSWERAEYDHLAMGEVLDAVAATLLPLADESS